MKQPPHYSPLYRTLRSTNPQDFQRIIREYERQEQEIGRLDVVEYFELTCAYVDALFETGAYRRHQLMVDLVIHASIQHNLHRVPGIERDIFHHSLFRKAASAYRIQDYGTATHVLRELIRMDPGEELYFRFLRAALFRAQVSVLQFGRAAFIFCMLLTAFLITLNLLFVKPFYPEQVSVMQFTILDTWLIGIFVLVGSYGYALWRAHRESTAFRRAAENKE